LSNNLDSSCTLGLAPGSLVYVGEHGETRTRAILTHYDGEYYEERHLERIEEAFEPMRGTGVRWIHISGFQDVKVVEAVGNRFGLNPLVLEDVLDSRQRPKIEEHERFLFMVLKIAYPGETTRFEQLSIIMGDGLVISLQEGDSDIFAPVRLRTKEGKGCLRVSGVDYLTYALLDAVADFNFLALENLGTRIRSLEQDILKCYDNQILDEVCQVKWETLTLRTQLWSFRELITHLRKSPNPLIQKTTRPYLEDLYDHTIQAVDTVKTFQAIATSFLDVHISMLNQSANKVMQFLTVIATIFIPLTFFAGVYGMNFKYMPELDWQWGYYVFWLAMLVLVMVMLLYFKQRKWL
jgi:magnesium transporter